MQVFSKMLVSQNRCKVEMLDKLFDLETVRFYLYNVHVSCRVYVQMLTHHELELCTQCNTTIRCTK